jgi:hypothetical protein
MKKGYYFFYILVIAFFLLFPVQADNDKDYEIRDYTPEGFVKQPSFVEKGGMMNKNEHAFILYADGAFLPPAIMLGYRYGINYWWEIGFDAGGDYGLFQALFHTKMEMFKTRKTELFFWALQLKFGYKYHKFELNKDNYFDDKSLVLQLDNSLAIRLGKKRDKVLYYDTLFYVDIDLHSPRRQTDFYIGPVILGYEMMIGKFLSFFIEAGWIISLNGMETDKGLYYDGDSFPVGKIGIAFRTGERTAIYYSKETKDQIKK